MNCLYEDYEILKNHIEEFVEEAREYHHSGERLDYIRDLSKILEVAEIECYEERGDLFDE